MGRLTFLITNSGVNFIGWIKNAYTRQKVQFFEFNRLFLQGIIILN